jgi:pyruvate formate lyase activating enzyme
MLTPQELYKLVKIYNLYFQATGGGICFGGGEPTLYADFIEEFRRICNVNWKITLETSLYCSHGTKRQLSGIVDHWIVDVKSIHSSIYESYTGEVSGILQFLRSLQMLVPQEKVTIKVPRIPNYNDDYDLIKDVNEIKRRFGFENVEIVDYKILK